MTLYLLHGADTFSSRARLRALRAEHDPSGFNSVALDGAETTIEQLRAACDTLAFFGSGRFVEVHGLLTRWGAGGGKPAKPLGEHTPLAALAAYLPRLPETTALAFWEPGAVDLPPALQQACRARQANLERFEAPLGRELREWVIARARAHDVTIEVSAAEALLDAVCPQGWREAPRGRDSAPPNLQRLDTELQKLATAVQSRPQGPSITARVVAALVTGEAAPDIFALVNAVADRHTGLALGRLRALLDHGVAPEALLPLLASQFSLLLRVPAAGGGRADRQALARRLGVSPGRAGHLVRQYTQLGAAGVARCHQVVLAADEAIKTGRAPHGDDALYWAVLELCGAGASAPGFSPATTYNDGTN